VSTSVIAEGALTVVQNPDWSFEKPLGGQISRPSNLYLLKTSFVRYRSPATPTSQQ